MHATPTPMFDTWCMVYKLILWDEDFRHCIPCEQGLLRELMKLVEKDESQWKLAAEAHAGVLSQRNMHEDAAVAYLAAKLPEQALASYRAAGQWQMAFALAGKDCPPICAFLGQAMRLSMGRAQLVPADNRQQ